MSVSAVHAAGRPACRPAGRPRRPGRGGGCGGRHAGAGRQHDRRPRAGQPLLLMSGNDAANALARAAGGVPQTVALMNAEAVRLQAYDTHAATPSGLDGPGQATSAYDLALIARAGLHRADFSRYVAQRAGMLPRVSAKYPEFHISNQNRLLYNYAGAFGVKTGFTDAARHTFVGADRKS